MKQEKSLLAMSFYKYISARRKAFTAYHRGVASGSALLLATKEINAASLDLRLDAGLRAEVDFYDEFREKYSLTLAADCGDSCDFTGIINNRPVRIDVTTNTNFKKIVHYTKASCCGYEYVLAVRAKGELKFQFNPVWSLGSIDSPCHSVHSAIPMIVIYPEVESQGGSPDGWNLIKDIAFCPSCGVGHIVKEIDSFRIPTLSEYAGQVDEYLRSFRNLDNEDALQLEARAKNRDYLSNVYHYLKDVLGHEILAIGEYRYITISPKGDGYYGVEIVKKSPCIESWLPSEVEIED